MIAFFPQQDVRRLFASNICIKRTRRTFLIAFNISVVKAAQKNYYREEGGVNSLQKTKRGN